MSNNKKGPIPAQDQALQISKLNTTPIHHIKCQTKKERAYMMILQSGANGITGLDIQSHCHVISGRNFPSELKQDAGISLKDAYEPNFDGDGQHKRYWITCRKDAAKLVRFINEMRARRHVEPLSVVDVESLLSLYEPAPEQAA
jgi:hypothetical protein